MEIVCIPALIWLCFLFGGFALAKPNPYDVSLTPPWTRIVASLALVVLAWIGAEASQGSYASEFVPLIAVGITLSFVSDLFIARLIPVKQSLLIGIVFSCLAHIAYIWAFLILGNETTLIWVGERPTATILTGIGIVIWCFWLVMGVLAWSNAIGEGQNHSPLYFATLIHTLFLSTTAAFTTILALRSYILIPLAIGCGVLLLSNLISTARLFRGTSFYLIDSRIATEDVVWLLYSPATFVIVGYALLFAIFSQFSD